MTFQVSGKGRRKTKTTREQLKLRSVVECGVINALYCTCLSVTFFQLRLPIRPIMTTILCSTCAQ